MVDYALSEGHFASIGRVALESTQMEMTLDFLIPAILRLEMNVYKTLTSGKPLAQKIQMFRQAGLSKLRGKNKIEQFKKLTSEMADLNEYRNIAVHGRWSPDKIDKIPLGNLFKFNTWDNVVGTTPKDKHRRLTRKRLVEMPKRMAEINSELFSFWREAWVMPANRRKHTLSKKKLKLLEEEAIDRAEQPSQGGGL